LEVLFKVIDDAYINGNGFDNLPVLLYQHFYAPGTRISD
jgi:hypothetical protein